MAAGASAAGCLVCGATAMDRLLTMLSPFDPRLRRRVAICRACGHVQIHPLPGDDDLARAHVALFGSKYHTTGRGEAHARRVDSILSALDGYLVDGAVICDIGAGEGWLLDNLPSPEIRYLAIEPMPEFAADIARRGGEVIGPTLEAFDPSWAGMADIAVFRHVLEHLKQPRSTLSRIHALLRPGGHLYVALPNATRVDSKKGFRTSYLRPVHLSYFHPEHVAYLLTETGFDVVSTSLGGETAIVACRRAGDVAPCAPPNVYAEQAERYRARGRAALPADIMGVPRVLAGWAKRWLH